jgi:hypothetical protein
MIRILNIYNYSLVIATEVEQRIQGKPPLPS